jgi:hypothetical protein
MYCAACSRGPNAFQASVIEFQASVVAFQASVIAFHRAMRKMGDDTVPRVRE